MKIQKIAKSAASGFILGVLCEIVYVAYDMFRTFSISLSMKHISLATALLGIAIFQQIKSGVLKKEREVFSPSTCEKDYKAIIQIIVAHILLVLPFFAMIHLLLGQYMNPYRSILLLVLLLVISPTVYLIKIHKEWKTGITVLAYLGLGCYILVDLLIHWAKWTAESYLYIGQIGNVLLLVTQIVGLLLIVVEFKIDFARGGVTFLGLILLYFSSLVTGQHWFMNYYGCICLANLLGKRRTTAKFYLGMLTSFVIFMIIAYYKQWSNILYYERKGEIVSALGMGHTNSVALLIMVITLLVWYLWIAKRKVLTVLLFIAAAVCVWFVTYCRTVAVLLVIMAAANLLPTEGRAGKRRANKYIFAVLPFAAILISLVLTYAPGDFLRLVDRNFSARFTIPYQALQEYSIQWLGNRINYSKYIIDNFYLRALLGHGIVTATLLMLVFSRSGYILADRGNKAEKLMFLLYILYGMMEGVPGYISVSFVPILAQSEELKETSKKTE